MEMIVKILFFVANWRSFFFVPLIFVVVSLFLFRKSFANAIRLARSEGRDVPVLFRLGHIVGWLGLLSACAMFIFVLANLFWPHFADAGFIYRTGNHTNAKITNIKMYSEVNDPELIVRYEIMYQTNAGELVETYFHSSDHNFYPPAGSINYAQSGESFRIAYLSGSPTTFVVLTDADSPAKTRAACLEIAQELNRASSRRDLEPENEQYAQELAAATKRFVDAGCRK